MIRNLTLLLILLVLVMPSQAASITVSSVGQPAAGGCTVQSNFSVTVQGSFNGTIADSGADDVVSVVLYDGRGTPLGISNVLFPVGVPSNTVAFTFSLQVDAQARPFTIKFFETTQAESLSTAPSFPLVESISFDPGSLGLCTTLPLLALDELTGIPYFLDERINKFDMANPIVVYGHDFEDGRGLVVYSPEGALLMTVTAEEIGECSGETVLLAEENGISLYRLDTCEYQMMAASVDGAKTYILIFNALYTDLGYTSWEE